MPVGDSATLYGDRLILKVGSAKSRFWDIEDAVQDVEDAVRVALNQHVLLGAGAVKLQEMVREAEREYEVVD